MSLHKALKNLKFDKRLTEYNLNKGLLTKEELQQHVGSLQDISDKAGIVNLSRNDSDDRDQMDTH